MPCGDAHGLNLKPRHDPNGPCDITSWQKRKKKLKKFTSLHLSYAQINQTPQIHQIAKNSITKSKEVYVDLVALPPTRRLLGYLLPAHHGHACGAGWGREEPQGGGGGAQSCQTEEVDCEDAKWREMCRSEGGG
jgi:hypothetical protein